MQSRDDADKSIKIKIYCNCCGKAIGETAIVGTHMDYLYVEKQWGYFSSKDFTKQSFNICEQCYDQWVSSFKIPVQELPVDDISSYSDEEMELLCEAYRKAAL